MFEIDKKRFGAFVSALRKEKGYTQKEMAQKLLISDKAISKWETGVSIPDTALLIPLSELLGVTVTELLMCRRMEAKEPMDAGQVESIVKTAIAYSEEKPVRAYQTKNRWSVIYFCSLAVGVISTACSFIFRMRCNTLLTAEILSAVFGAYFCFFVKAKLPAYYDENRCGLYLDGAIRMNVPGIAFNNSNWPHIVGVGRVWSCSVLALYPILNIGMNQIPGQLWQFLEIFVFLFFLLGGLFLPIYIVGKKYQ